METNEKKNTHTDWGEINEQVQQHFMCAIKAWDSYS